MIFTFSQAHGGINISLSPSLLPFSLLPSLLHPSFCDWFHRAQAALSLSKCSQMSLNWWLLLLSPKSYDYRYVLLYLTISAFWMHLSWFRFLCDFHELITTGSRIDKWKIYVCICVGAVKYLCIYKLFDGESTYF